MTSIAARPQRRSFDRYRGIAGADLSSTHVPVWPPSHISAAFRRGGLLLGPAARGGVAAAQTVEQYVVFHPELFSS
jgi:hypothetical protein